MSDKKIRHQINEEHLPCRQVAVFLYKYSASQKQCRKAYYGYPVFHPAMLMVVFMLMFMLMVMMSMLSCFVFHNYVFIMVLFTGAKV